MGEAELGGLPPSPPPRRNLQKEYNMYRPSDVAEYLDEAEYLGEPPFESVEALFKDCVTYLAAALAPFQVNRKAVLRDLNERADQVARLVL